MPPTQVNSAVFSRDALRLVIATEHKLVVVYNTQTNERIQEVSAHATAVNAVAMALDGVTVCSAGADGFISCKSPAPILLLAYSFAKKVHIC